MKRRQGSDVLPLLPKHEKPGWGRGDSRARRLSGARPSSWLMRRAMTRVLLVSAMMFAASIATAQVEFEKPPINYLEARPRDAISKLQQAIDAGRADHSERDRHVGVGYIGRTGHGGVPKSQMRPAERLTLAPAPSEAPEGKAADGPG